MVSITRVLFSLPLSSLILISCVQHDLVEPVNCDQSGLTIGLGEVVSATNCSTTDGAFTVLASGGKEPYTFFLNDGLPASAETFTTLAPGIYNVRLRDANGCEVVLENIAVMAQDFSFTATVQADTRCTGGNGSVIINVVDGNPPYTYKFGDEAFTPDSTFQSLASGDYTIVAKDVNDCAIALNVTVPRGFSGISWSSDIKPLVKTYCALSGCHDGKRRPDLRLYEKAKFYAKSIKTKTQDRSMPFEGSLTQEQIDIIACWVDDGALDN